MKAAMNSNRQSKKKERTKNEQPKVLLALDGRKLPLPIFDLVRDQPFNNGLLKRLSQNGVGTFAARTIFYYGGSAEEKSIRQIVRKADSIARNAPEAYLFLSIMLRPSTTWRRENPDELYTSKDGQVCLCENTLEGHFFREKIRKKDLFRAAQPSIFSVRETRDISRALGRLFSALKKRPYFNRLAGAFIGKYVHGEWQGPHWYPDYSSPARTYLKNFLKKKYRTLDKLRLAWSDPNAHFNNPVIPARESAYFRLDMGVMHIETQALKDYLEAEAFALGNKFYECCRAVKDVNSTFIAGGFFPYSHTYQSEIRSFLGDGVIDFVSTPFEYWDRHPGSGIDTQSPYPKMPSLHNAVYFDELDTRTHMANRNQNNLGRARNSRQSTGILWRDAGQMLLKGNAGWWLDFGGHFAYPGEKLPADEENRCSWHDHPTILKFHKQFRDVWEKAEKFDRASCADVRVFYPRRNNRTHIWKLTLAKRIEFPMMGLPFEEYDFDDLLEGLVEPARLNILYWPVSLSDVEIKKLHSLQKKHKADWVYFGPTGMLNPDKISVPEIDRMETVTGFKHDIEWFPVPETYQALPVKRLAKSPLNGLKVLGQSLKPLYSKNTSWFPGNRDLQKTPDPPVTCPLKFKISIREENDAETLAVHQGSKESAFSIRQTGNGKIYSYALPVMQSDLFRVLTEWAGGNVYVKEDCFLCASRGLLLLHHPRDGRISVHFPGNPLSVQDIISGKKIAVQGSKSVISGKKADTHFLKLIF